MSWWGLNIERLLKKHDLHNSNYVIYIKNEVFFSICIVCFPFFHFKSETSLNFSTFEQQDLAKNKHLTVIMT